MLVDHLHAESGENRQDPHQRQGRTHPEHLQTLFVVGRVQWFVEGHGDPVIAEALPTGNVGNGGTGGVGLTVGVGQCRAVVRRHFRGIFLTELVHQCVGELVVPGANRGPDTRLEAGDVDGLIAVGRIDVDDVVQACKHRIRDGGGVVHCDPVEGLHENRLDGLPGHGGVPVTREIHQHRVEAPVGVTTQENPDHATFLHTDNGFGHGVQLVGVHLEQVVSRVPLNEMHEVPAPVGQRIDLRHVERLLLHAAQHWDRADRLGVGGPGVEPEEPTFPDHCARLVEALHPDVVEVRTPVDAGTGVGLGEHQDVGLPSQLPHLGGQFRERGRGVRSVLHHPQRCVGQRGEGVPIGRKVVLPVAEKREVVVGQPVEEVGGLGNFIGVDSGGRVCSQVRGKIDGVVTHGLPVGHCAAHILKRPADVIGEGVEIGAISLATHLHTHPGLGQCVVGTLFGGDYRGAPEDFEQVAVGIAPHQQLRMND